MPESRPEGAGSLACIDVSTSLQNDRMERVVIDREELAWAAGFFDGEGCFSYVKTARYGVATISQTSPEPLQRFQRAVGGLGKIYGPYEQKAHRDRWSRKPQWSFRAQRRDDVQAIAAMLWFKLGTVKRSQAVEVLRLTARTCRRGHRLTGHSCPQCIADAWASKREQRAARRGQAQLKL